MRRLPSLALAALIAPTAQGLALLASILRQMLKYSDFSSISIFLGGGGGGLSYGGPNHPLC